MPLDTRMIGVAYNIPPQPPVEASTEWFPAGAVTIGVEYRALDPDNLYETYKDNPEQLKEMLEKSPDGGFNDEGVSLHVRESASGHEYLRFDVFDGEPHYHYIHSDPNEIINHVVGFDTAAHGDDMMDFAIGCIRSRLAAMLPKATGGHLVGQLDAAKIDAVMDTVEPIARKAQADSRRTRQLLAK